MPRLARGSGTLAVATAQTLVPVAVRPPRPRSAVQAGDRRRSAGGPCLPSSLESCDINILPFETQVKHLPLSPSHDHPLKLKVTFCVRGVISPLLANIYLHYALDEWFAKVVKKGCQGEAYLVRYADDFVACFEYETDACRFRTALAVRLGRFKLELEPRKTQLLRFGRFARWDAQTPGARVAVFDFLGLTQYCGTSRTGRFKLKWRTSKRRFRVKLRSFC